MGNERYYSMRHVCIINLSSSFAWIVHTIDFGTIWSSGKSQWEYDTLAHNHCCLDANHWLFCQHFIFMHRQVSKHIVVRQSTMCGWYDSTELCYMFEIAIVLWWLDPCLEVYLGLHAVSTWHQRSRMRRWRTIRILCLKIWSKLWRLSGFVKFIKEINSRTRITVISFMIKRSLLVELWHLACVTELFGKHSRTACSV